MNLDTEIKQHILLFTNRYKNVSFSEKKVLFLEYQTQSSWFPLSHAEYQKQLLFFINNLFKNRFELEGLLLSKYIYKEDIRQTVNDLINIYKQINQK